MLKNFVFRLMPGFCRLHHKYRNTTFTNDASMIRVCSCFWADDRSEQFVRFGLERIRRSTQFRDYRLDEGSRIDHNLGTR